MSKSETPVDARRHAQLGAEAVARGWISVEVFGEVMLAVGALAEPRSVESVWVEPGHITREQLAGISIGAAETVATAGMPAMTVPLAKPTTDNTAVSGSGATGGALAEIASAEHRYARLRTAGQGGMGVVFECLDQRMGRRVALKSLRKELWEGGAAAAMLEREARITGSLEHPNIMPVHDMGRDEALGPYYVMRFADLPTLGSVLESVERGGAVATEWGLGRLLRAFIQVCHAADYAHSRGIVHCDLKPSNILLGLYGEVLVLDWGMSFKPAEGTPFRGGTVGYMAPEQAGGNRPIDARTDVHGLGAILYQILALRCPFDQAPPFDPDETPLVLRPPSEVAPTRDVPGELEAIAIKALQPVAEDRHASARALATSIEDFLEGTLEKERAQARAGDLCEQALMLEENFDDFLRSREEHVEELGTMRRSVATWEPSDKKVALWDAEERLHVMDALSMRMLNGAVAAYERALEEVPGHGAGRAGLARLYLGEARRAQARRDEMSYVYFEDLARHYGDQTTSEALDADGLLRVDAPAGCAISVAGVRERGRRLVADASPRSVPAGEDVVLPPGRYLASVTPQADAADAAAAADAGDAGTADAPVHLPFVVHPGARVELAFDPSVVRTLRPGEVLVAPGPALLELDGGTTQEHHVPGFIMDALPVSVADYLQFIAESAEEDPRGASTLVPRGGSGAPLWRVDGSRVLPLGALEFGDSDALALLPVFGIDAISAMAYARWHSARTGLVYRIPTEVEWERAGRGADGRLYPWGDHFDASFCKMRESRPGLPHPEPRGAFADDVSPFGVRDLAGGVAEWAFVGQTVLETLDANSRLVSRGGAWCDWSADCSLTSRRVYLAVERSPRVGFRMVRALPSTT